MRRRKIRTGLMALGILAAVHAAGANAQAYPSRPVTIVVPYGAGPTDSTARLLGEHLRAAWNQTVVNENRPGANGMIGALAVARAAPDGYTLLYGGVSLASYKALYKKPEIDVERDLSGVSLVTTIPLVMLVSSQVPVSSLGEFISYAKARPGRLNYASVGGGATLIIESFTQLVGIDLVRVSYKGESLAAVAVSQDEVQFTFLSPVSAKTFTSIGKAKALALSTATARSRAMPEIPSASEAGLQGYDQSTWFGVVAPANTPLDIRRRIAKEIALFVAKPDIVNRLVPLGIEPQSNSPEEFSKMISTEIARYVEVGRKAKIEPE